MSAAYLLRPNDFAISLIDKYGIKDADELNGHCVSVYVKQGNDEEQ